MPMKINNITLTY